jgi:protein TonB
MSELAVLGSGLLTPAASQPTDDPVTPAPARLAFGAFLTEAGSPRRPRGRRLTVSASIALHVAALVGVAVASYWNVEEITPPTVSVRMLVLPAPPPPPAPPMVARAAPSPPRPSRPQPLVQPRPVVEPPPEPLPEPPAASEPAGTTNGLAGGVTGGAEGGVIGAVTTAAPPPPPPPRPPELAPQQRKALLDRYLHELLRTRIAARHSYPPEAERLGAEGKVVIRVAIDRSGRLLGLSLAGACPHEVLCDAAQRTIRDATPFPPPPAELGGTIAVEVPLSYRLE